MRYIELRRWPHEFLRSTADGFVRTWREEGGESVYSCACEIIDLGSVEPNAQANRGQNLGDLTVAVAIGPGMADENVIRSWHH